MLTLGVGVTRRGWRKQPDNGRGAEVSALLKNSHVEAITLFTEDLARISEPDSRGT
jgi:hypothetical protein